ncbi:MAG: UDP-glucose 4-epimerase [candidate division TM6 bacterium GW2011_GWF2_38_10]|nr:MAG: UDP-glucose 4-epimerase [candidate division TM6 bacterium GW2011_GWF2_38_10]
MKKTILVTGGAGYIGSHTVYELVQQGYHVVVIDNFVYNQPWPFVGVQLERGSIADTALLERVFSSYDVECVMHFAAFIEVGQSVLDPQRFYENNVVNSLNLLNAMVRCNVTQFIFSSSCAVYGNPQYLPLNEEHVFEPQSPYGKNKLMVEYALQDYAHAYGIRFVSLRYFNAAGAAVDHNLGEWHEPETHIIPNVMRAALKDKELTVFGVDYETLDGSCIRDYVHVFDIAQAHVRAYTYLSAGGVSNVFNVGTGRGFSVLELIAAAERVVEKKIRVLHAPRRAGDVPILVADNAKITRELGWRACYSTLDTMCSSAFAWEKRRLNHGT